MLYIKKKISHLPDNARSVGINRLAHFFLKHYVDNFCFLRVRGKRWIAASSQGPYGRIIG